MFRFSSETLPLSEACLQTLCPSLNSPVVNIDELPVAPAQAAIVVYAEEYGDLILAIGLRSLESGQVALFKYRDALHSPEQVPMAVESARAFAEGMGFLFDDDMLEVDPSMGRHHALLHWNQLMGEDGSGGEPMPDEDAASVAETPSAPATDRELLLDDLVGLAREDDTEFVLDEETGFEENSPEEFTLTDEIGSDVTEVAEVDRLEASAPVAPTPALTKFRRPSPVASKRASAQTPSALGRIPIVKMKQGDAAKPSTLARLLASF